MPRSHKPYPPQFRQQMVELVRAGRTPEELSRVKRHPDLRVKATPSFTRSRSDGIVIVRLFGC
jgi:hypothetical protein